MTKAFAQILICHADAFSEHIFLSFQKGNISVTQILLFKKFFTLAFYAF